ncbi:MAG TPA: histidine phosphatase family protein [Streptosporangiaceae bacterium]|nr:histidine phosphatase family protein [Streptosporangiaceae bacterium]
MTAAEDAAAPSWWPGGDEKQLVTLVVWRHGLTRYNAERRFQGQSDVPLNEVGRAQAAQAAPYLAALRPSAIYSSDLSRASGTADALARLTGLPVHLDKDLRERSGGSWEGLTEREIAERYPVERATWTPPDGESGAAVADRASAALERIADGMSGGSLAVVVGHGAALGLAIARLLGIPSEPRVLGPFGNCHWSVLSRRGTRWRLLDHNVGVLPEPAPDGRQGGKD